jgi:hypothetical protein
MLTGPKKKKKKKSPNQSLDTTKWLQTFALERTITGIGLYPYCFT